MISRDSDDVFTLIRAEIIAGALPPGSPLDPGALSGRLGVPIPALEEALGRLGADGLVALGEDGLVVTMYDSDYLVELFELREALETQVARLAARRHRESDLVELAREFAHFSDTAVTDPPRVQARFYELVDRFDRAIDDAAANSFLTDALIPVRGHLTRLRTVNPSLPRFLAAAREQAQILEAILERDEVLAMQMTAVHLRSSLTSLLGRLGVTSTWSHGDEDDSWSGEH